ncbi:MAG: site-specific integrase [Clostridia bacterium]|nr:MAG: site-specific integrase [Clostridia bacterium]
MNQVRKLLAATEGTPLYVIVYLAVNTGLRRGELLGLKWEDVDMGVGVAYIRRVLQKVGGHGYVFREPKTPKSRRSVALAPSVVEVLKKHRARQAEEKLLMGEDYNDLGLVLAQPDGSPINPSTLSGQFRRLAAKAGLHGLRFHDLRHTHATLTLKAGVHPKIVSERLGHSSVGITLDTYSHVLPGLQEEAARKLDEQLFGTASSRPCRAN